MGAVARYQNPYPYKPWMLSAGWIFKDDLLHWESSFLDSIPERWNLRISKLFSDKWHGKSRKEANEMMRNEFAHLGDLKIPLNATDSEIVEIADMAAAKVCGALDYIKGTPDIEDRPNMKEIMHKEAGEFICMKYGIAPPKCESLFGAIARMKCPLWWRRQLRKMISEKVERVAISLGFVRKGRDAYVSNESLYRRISQNKRNRAILERTTLVNELEQQYTLAELSDLGVANKSIRRNELMVRIKGMDELSKEMNHAAMFITITCPSRMHKWAQKNGKVIENKNYDHTISPKDAQAYLVKVFSWIRAKMHRNNLQWYGFRIVEPHHDGTPHWHLLMFAETDQVDEIKKIVREYALKDSPNEAGADEHRCTFVDIDRSKGSAVGYVAKYVAKNIDGYAVGKDLIGMDAIESSARVEAWAATWGIRQFQQIGGAPVGVWRELRRVKEKEIEQAQHEISYQGIVPDKKTDEPEMPGYLLEAWEAAHKWDDETPARFDKYMVAQGGVFVGRKARIQIMRDREVIPEKGRYGDELNPSVVGVKTSQVGKWRHGLIANMERLVTWIVESSRHIWRKLVGSKTEGREA